MPTGKRGAFRRVRERRKSQAEETLAQNVKADIAKDGFVAGWRKHLGEIVALQRGEEMTSHEIALQLAEYLDQDPEISAHFDKLTEFEAEALRKDLEQDLLVAPDESVFSEDFIGRGVFGLADLPAEEHPEILEQDGRPVRLYRRKKFRNWGKTVKNRPKYTLIPRTIGGVQNIVRFAKKNGKTVRVSGYRHTWSDMYSDKEEMLISLLPLKFVDQLPAREAELNPNNELQGIEMVGEIVEDGKRKGLCKIGAATTNEMFREWVLGKSKADWKEWTIPLNVIMVEITYGGSNAPICHGAGIETQTLSDLVHEIELVNANGDRQKVNDPELLKTAAGCFGLLGVVVSLTLKLDPMTYAELKPVDKRVALAVPPPPGFDVPDEIDMDKITPAKLEKARQDFIDRAENHYYAEWFWFPYNDKCWVNTWKNTGTKKKSVDYPSPVLTKIQEGLESIAHVMNRTLWKILPGKLQARVIGESAMLGLPDGEKIMTPLIDALHFQRGIQNMRVLNMEIEIPIPASPDDPTKPDWTLCQRAWWDAIKVVYDRDDAPLRIALEMRVTGDSNVHMAPQHGNTFGTCSIEILTTPNVDEDVWLDFMQEILDHWTSYKDAAGNFLNVRPHWAKQWQGLRMFGKDVNEYLKQDAYGDRIPAFKAGLEQIGAAAAAEHGAGFTLADIQKRFSNPLLDDIFEDVFS